MRAPSWIFVVALLAIVGLGVYGYFTTPLPFGLNSVVRTPGGANAQPGTGAVTNPATVAPGARVAIGQPLPLGAVTVNVTSVQKGQDVTANGTRGPAGLFTLVAVSVQNGGRDPLPVDAASFRLLDERGRAYAVDVEASKSGSALARRRGPFEAAVPPGGRLDTVLAFETAADSGSLSLRVALGYGELEIAR